jgi:tetratricopeptide (TPR) repeat protein
VVIPVELLIDQPTIALATSAQYGRNSNPAVAYGNIAISRNGTAGSEYTYLDLPSVPGAPTRLPDVKALVDDSMDQISSLSRQQTKTTVTDIQNNARTLADQVNQAFARKPDPRYMESGFVLASTQVTLADARKLYTDLETHCKGWNQNQAAALARWTELLEDTEAKRIDQASLKTEFRKLMLRTQGGISKLVNSVQLAEATLAFATDLSATDPQAAQGLLDAISDDPVFDLPAARAKLLKAELSGEGLKAAQTAFNREKAAFDLKNLALQDHANKNRTEAVAKLDSLLEQYPDTLQAADARIRKGYIFCADHNDEAAVAAFTEALEKNQALGADHGLNLEAVARLKYLKHHELYNRPTDGPFDSTTKKEENQPLLDEVLQLNETWIQSLPSDSPDRCQAILEQGGILFEQALYLNNPGAWESVRSYLTEMILEEENVDIGIRSIADLMILETYSKEKRYEDCVAASKLMPEKYPKQWKAIGTAKVFEFVSLKWLDRRSEAHEVMTWVRETIPADAPHFGICNYHTVALVSLAQQLRKQGNLEEYTRVYNLVQQDQTCAYSGTIKHPEEIRW